MSELTLGMSLDNAAFEDDPSFEITRILRDLADKIEQRGLQDEMILWDLNGNRVGKVAITRDDD
ncbi:MAG: hypothetical protein VBE63_18435 [Lamprobacter sp.]|uniref:hypothetical protein n=1 Tax=Lamprobacter sp. TaxID=3100796 RepID=UPI002B26300C|nr:hypothetical protein [Lamprobacter sp.]MEA3641894.1 hypothetical protein [Lamprobacter sp.]